ncbi:hypothetical protein D046_2729B, partial [Vibrio parahaemolyticus V-223/04]
PSL